MKKIPSNFIYEKYGLVCRLVQEGDAPFILKLRTDEKLSRFIHSIDDDLDKQIMWIRQYKEREKNGKDYYFIYYSGSKPVGVNRIYNITENSSTSGSWLCSKDATVEESIATNFISFEIEELFELPPATFNVSKGNNQVLKFNLNMGAEIIDENNNEYTLRMNREKYVKAKNRYLKLLNL